MPSVSRVSAVSPYRRRLSTAALCSIGVMVVLYTAGTLPQKNNSTNDTNSKVRVSSTPNDLPSSSIEKAAELEALHKSALNRENCPFHQPVDTLSGRKPVWVAGYPGSGFDMVAHLISAVAGVTVVDVYRHHGCSGIIKDGAAPTGACLTHWPLVDKDSPSSLAVKTGTMYHPQAIFVIRNPAQAIPSYHTRWWGAKKKQVYGNHEQPEIEKWQKWRNKQLQNQTAIWKRSLVEWYRGIPAAGVSGIGFILPFEQFTSSTYGPNITERLSHFVATTVKHHVVDPTYRRCIWKRVWDEEHHSPKVYNATYTPSQKQLFLNTLDELIQSYQAPTDAILRDVLQGYRDDIDANLPLDTSSSP